MQVRVGLWATWAQQEKQAPQEVQALVRRVAQGAWASRAPPGRPVSQVCPPEHEPRCCLWCMPRRWLTPEPSTQ